MIKMIVNSSVRNFLKHELVFLFQGQLLSNVVTHERPHLEAQRGELLNNIATDLRLLQELEDKALMLLEVCCVFLSGRML